MFIKGFPEQPDKPRNHNKVSWIYLKGFLSMSRPTKARPDRIWLDYLVRSFMRDETNKAPTSTIEW